MRYSPFFHNSYKPVPRITKVGYNFNPSGRKAGFSNNSLSINLSSNLYLKPRISRSYPILGRSGIICVTTLNPQSYSINPGSLSYLGLLERVTHRSHRMTTIGITCDILCLMTPAKAYFINTLHTDFNTGATIAKHVVQMGFQTVVRTGFNGNRNTFRDTLLTISGYEISNLNFT